MKKVTVRNTNSKKYAAVLRRIEKDNVCPFCTKHFLKYHTRPIIKNGKHWILTDNFSPYPGATHQLLAVAKKHVNHFESLSPAARAELFSLFAAEVKKRKIKGGGMFMRFGDSDYNSSTVRHLHAQLITGVKRSKNTEVLAAPLAFKKKV